MSKTGLKVNINWDKVYSIASNLREELECIANDKVLQGYCAIASGSLHKKLREAGIPSTIHVKSTEIGSHCFVVVDKRVVDVTATQFREFAELPVLIKSLRSMRTHKFYSRSLSFNDIESLYRYQVKQGWPDEQVTYEI
jgi:hypothetical protein